MQRNTHNALIHMINKELLLAFSSIALLITSCEQLTEREYDPLYTTLETKATDDRSDLHNNTSSSFPIIEEAFPNQEKQVICLPNGTHVEVLDSLYILQGDIILTEEQVSILRGESTSVQTKSLSTNEFVRYWPKHTVYYTFSSNFSMANEVHDAMTEWSNKTGLDFVYGTGRGNYIEFKNSNNGSASSHVGMTGGRQTIELQPGVSNTGSAMHEIGHAVGLFHEHCRPDRDNYIIVYRNRIQLLKRSQFDPQPYSSTVVFGPFDFSSIMMYPSYAFQNSSAPSMTTIDGQEFGFQRDSLSTLDAEGIKAIYGPPYHKLESTIIESNYYDYGTSEEWSETVENHINFYSDKECTIPTSLVYDRRMKVILHTIEYNNGSSIDYYNESNIVIPAGTSSIFVGISQTSMHSDYGIDSGRREEYELAY